MDRQARSRCHADIPRVDDLDSAALKVSNVARGQSGPMSASSRSDLTVSESDRPPGATAITINRSERTGSGTVEGQDSTGEVLVDHRVDGLLWAREGRQRRVLAYGARIDGKGMPGFDQHLH